MVKETTDMKKTIEILKKYLKDTLGIEIEVMKWKEADKLPFFLQDSYEFFCFNLAGRKLLCMIAREQIEKTPAVIYKHLMTLTDIWDGDVLYLDKQVSSYNRKRLIEHKVPFIIPGNQMYLPMLAIDLREHFRAIHKVNHKFSPSTQVVLLYILSSKNSGPFYISALANLLGYTSMTIGRTFKELEFYNAGEVKEEGRERVLYMQNTRKELWNRTKQYMKSPIKKHIWINSLNLKLHHVQAGLTALAKYTLISEPSQMTFAVNAEEWRVLKNQIKLIEVPSIEKEAYHIEIWNYSPKKLTKNNIADPYSLYLSLQDYDDDRVKLALEEMMENIEW
jgi:hypothetical protein